MFLIPGLDPWNPLISSVSEYLLSFKIIQTRYELSVTFCGPCGDRYLLTAGFFILLSIIYSLVVLAALLRGIFLIGRDDGSGYSRKAMKKAASICFLAAGVFFFVAWALLFLPDMAKPSSVTPSYSDYTMFDFKLVLLISVFFHVFVLFLMLLVDIVGNFLGAVSED